MLTAALQEEYLQREWRALEWRNVFSRSPFGGFSSRSRRPIVARRPNSLNEAVFRTPPLLSPSSSPHWKVFTDETPGNRCFFHLLSGRKLNRSWNDRSVRPFGGGSRGWWHEEAFAFKESGGEEWERGFCFRAFLCGFLFLYFFSTLGETREDREEGRNGMEWNEGTRVWGRGEASCDDWIREMD